MPDHHLQKLQLPKLFFFFINSYCIEIRVFVYIYFHKCTRKDSIISRNNLIIFNFNVKLQKNLFKILLYDDSQKKNENGDWLIDSTLPLKFKISPIITT